jgi:hypothetical protein
MYCGWHRQLSKVAWVLITLSVLTALIYLIVGMSGGWKCDFYCNEGDSDAQLLNEGIYSCHSDKNGVPLVENDSGAHQCTTWLHNMAPRAAIVMQVQ